MTRRCHACGREGGSGKRELRPYGPGGADVCAGCVFGEGDRPGSPERLAQAERALGAQLGMAGGIAVIDQREQAGPRPATSAERRALGAPPAGDAEA